MGVVVPLISYKRNPIAYTWSGTTFGPFKPYWAAATSGTMTPGNVAVNSGVAKETTPTGTANNGSYFSGICYQDPMGTSLHYAESTMSSAGTAASWPRAIGAGVGGSDSSFTNGVVALGADFASSPDGTQIMTKVGSTLTAQTTVATGWAVGDKLRLVVSHNGTNYVYTVYKNTATVVLQWVDTGNVTNPGVWTCAAFGASWSSAYFGSRGITNFSCGDTIAGAAIYSYTFTASTHGPFNDWGQGYSVNASAQANNNPAPAFEGVYYSGGVYTSAFSGPTHTSDITMTNITPGYDNGSGVAVAGSDSSFTNGVIAIGTTVVGGNYPVQILTKVGGTYTSVATGGSGAWAQGDVMRLECRYNGTNYVYNVFKNGTATGATWTDTGNVITPGPYAGFAFRHSYVSGNQYPANGIQGTWHGADI